VESYRAVFWGHYCLSSVTSFSYLLTVLAHANFNMHTTLSYTHYCIPYMCIAFFKVNCIKFVNGPKMGFKYTAY